MLIDHKLRQAVLAPQWLRKISIIHSNIKINIKCEQKNQQPLTHIPTINRFDVLHTGLPLLLYCPMPYCDSQTLHFLQIEGKSLH